MLYSDASRFIEKAKKAGVHAILQSWDEMVHVFQSTNFELLPEVEDIINKRVDFTTQILKTKNAIEILKY